MPVLLPVWKRLCTQHTGFHALLAGFLPFCRYVCPALGLGRPFGELCKEGGPNSEEVQLLVGLVLLGIYKTWKCPTAEERTGLVLLYGKFLSVYLLFQGGSWSALVLYLLNWLLVYVLIQPARYWGPVKAFPLTADGVERAVRLTTVAQAEGGGRQAKQQRRKLDEADQSFMAEAWVILFETKWAPAARYFTVPFAELANTYTSSRLHFGKGNTSGQERMSLGRERGRGDVVWVGMMVP